MHYIYTQLPDKVIALEFHAYPSRQVACVPRILKCLDQFTRQIFKADQMI